MGGRETENILTVVLFKSGQKMLWILEETLFTALFLNQGGGHALKEFPGQIPSHL